MQYDLNDLLQQLIAENGVALYLVEGMSPVFAIRMDPTETSPGVTLLAVEGPALSHNDTSDIIKVLGFRVRENALKDTEALNAVLENTGIRGASYSGINETVYQLGSERFEVFAFQTSRASHIEFRRAGSAG